MSERYWRRPEPMPTPTSTSTSTSTSKPTPKAMAAVLLATAGAAALTACGSAGNGRAPSTGNGAAPSAGNGATSSATAPAAFTAAQLQGALLGSVNGAAPVAPAEAGAYGGLPDVQTSKDSLRGVTVSPARCAQATVTGFNSSTFADAPASVVTFRVGRDGVSEVIVAASRRIAEHALASRLPADCSHYKATVDGKTFSYAVTESAMPGIAEQARALNVKAAGYADVNVWSVVYRGNGFVGAVTIVGPDASEQGAKVLAEQAYGRAMESLH